MLLLPALPAQAESVGNLRSVSAADGRDGLRAWELLSDNGSKLRIEVLGNTPLHANVSAFRSKNKTGSG